MNLLRQKFNNLLANGLGCISNSHYRSHVVGADTTLDGKFAEENDMEEYEQIIEKPKPKS